MKILGIMWEENSSVALMIDGVVVGAVSEERFSRIKNDERYPKNAIEAVLEEGGIKAEQLDFVAFIGTMWGPAYILTRHYSSFSVSDYIKEQHEYWYPVLYKHKKINYVDVFKEKIDLKQYPYDWKDVLNFIKKDKNSGRAAEEKNKEFFQDFRRNLVANHLGIDPKKVIFVDHSTGHAMYAYFGSPIREETLVLTADAWGDNINATINLVKNGKMKRISSSNDLLIARLYRYITLLLGLKPNEHEYKVMGLAPYAKEKYFLPTLKVFQETQFVSGLSFKFKKRPSDLYFYFREKLEGHRFDAIAGALQQYTEDILLAWIKNAIRKTKAKRICLAGGVAMNVKVNMKINSLPDLQQFFINPVPSDESQAIGACISVAYDYCIKNGLNPDKFIKPLDDAYLGPTILDNEVSELIESKKITSKYKIHKNFRSTHVARLISEGKVIARSVSRSEFGARALGNRSIIADPRNPAIIKVINEKIKNRDFWMPFAATVLESRAKDYLIGYKSIGAPYMTVAFETTPLGKIDLKAGLHPYDETCRPQVLKDGKNPGYEEIIKEFEKLTGVGGVLNTSFNLHGEPIVQTAKDAWRVFELSDIDALILNNILIEKI